MKKNRIFISAGYLSEDNLWYNILLSLFIHTEIYAASDISDRLAQTS